MTGFRRWSPAKGWRPGGSKGPALRQSFDVIVRRPGPSGPGVLWQRMRRDQMVLDDPAADEVFVDDAFENGRIALPIPRPFRIDDGNRPAFTDSQAVRLRPQDAAPIGQPELLEPPLEEVPGHQAAFLVATLRRRLVAAEKDVPRRDRHADRCRDRSLRVSRHLVEPDGRSAGFSGPRCGGPERAALRSLYSELFCVPLQSQLARRRHVAEER